VAKDITLSAIAAGKSVVTANKALLAEAGRELFQAARERGVSISFEASAGGGIPIVAALRDGLIATLKHLPLSPAELKRIGRAI